LGGVSELSCLALDKTGRLYVGRLFLISRLCTDGSIDATFDQNSGVDSHVRGIAIQADGKLLIGGEFTAVNRIPTERVARLNHDGSIDGSFKANCGHAIVSVAVDSRGRILIAGDFLSVNGSSRTRIARLSGDPDLLLREPTRNGERFEFSIASMVGKSYTVEFRDSLSEGSVWTSLANLEGDGSRKPVIDKNASSNARFYRLRID
jgi:hypothetical protein